MNREKSSRVRRHAKHKQGRSDNETSKDKDSEYSSAKEDSDEENTNIAPIEERAVSSSSLKSSRRQSVNLITSDDESEKNGGSTYTKSSSNDEKIEFTETVRNLENLSAKSDQDSESLGYEPSRHARKRKSRKKRKEKKHVSDSNRTEDEAYDEDVRSDVSRARKKLRGSQKSRKKRHRSRNSSPTEDSQEKELPITEILRKAQENPKQRYEEAVPLAELTTDRIYVQGRNGFNAVKIQNRTNGIFSRAIPKERGPPLFPIKVAIIAQEAWNGLGLVHQGLLAGMALMHFLLMQTFFRPSFDFLENYSDVSEYYTNVFSYLIIMCIISALDKFDLAHLNIEHFREIYSEHSRSFFAVPLYVATFCLHQTTLLVDENVSLLGYFKNSTTENNITNILVDEDLTTWQKVMLAKDSLAILAWFFVALGPREDMLLTHLKSMEKYAEIPENVA